MAVDLATGQVTTLVEGADFYSTPCVSPDGSAARVAGLESSEHAVGRHGAVRRGDRGGRHARQVAAGGGRRRTNRSFSRRGRRTGTLYFVSDRSNWWNLYAERDGKVAPVLPMEAEFGAPQWVFGTATYGFLADGRIVARYTQNGEWRRGA